MGIVHRRHGAGPYFISSVEASARQHLEAARALWSIENPLRRRLVVTFRAVKSRPRKYQGHQDKATLRQISHSLQRRKTCLKAAIQGKRLQAGRREDHLL